MAQIRTSSAPLFTSTADLQAALTEDTGTDPIISHPGANQFLGNQAASHDGQRVFAPNGNRVQDGALALLGTHSQLGSPNKANPTGAQDG